VTIGVEVLMTPPVCPEGLRAWLRSDELERAARLRDTAERARFATGRAVLRLGLARRTGRPPLEVAFDARCPSCGRPHGKPRPTLGTCVPAGHTSVSHAGDWVLVAFAPVAVGIDVERIAGVAFAGFDTLALSDEEQRELRRRSASARDAARVQAWVGKEAVLKLHEIGLRREPNTVHVGLSRSGRVIADPVAPGRVVALVEVPLDADHRAGLAVASDSVPDVKLVDARPLLTLAAGAAASARSAIG
jgi:4'-phosphopantetheinyl transferase